MALKGVPKSPEHRAKLAAANRGKKHSAETLAKMSATRKGRAVSAETRAKMSAAALGRKQSDAARARISAAKTGKPGRKLSDEERIAISLRRRGTEWSEEQRAKCSGRASHLWGKPPKHKARAIYRGQSFRSSWEVRVAKRLDEFGIRWEYEAHRFDLGECTYLPDFYLPDQGVFWEVKGWLDARSQRKTLLFREQHPETPLVLVTKSVLQLMRA